LLAGLLVSGCDVLGSAKPPPPPKAMTHARFVYLGNRACALETRSTRRLKKATTFAMAMRNLDRSVASYETLIAAFRRLRPPAADQASFTRLLRLLDGLDLTVRQFRDTVALGRRPGTRVLIRKLDREARHLDRRAVSLGLRKCAKS
jgi:hypothetical protein